MAVGITSYGSYVPYRRLKRAAIAQVLGIPAGKGERSVASFDEDSVSMAVEAARDALRAAPATNIRSIFFATTTPPYAEKLNAALVAAAAQLPLEIRAADSTGSTRVGLSALLQAADAARGSGGESLAAIADCRLAAPEGKAEQTGGDAAVAFVVGSERIIAEIVASASVTREFLDTWRAPGERFAHTWEERFALTQAYAPLLGAAVKRVLEEAKCAPGDLAKVVLDAPNPRAADEIVRGLKLAPEKLADPLALTVGQTGAAHAPLLLANVLAAAKPGDRILVATAADGADAILFKVTDAAAAYSQQRSVGRLIESKGDVAYARYLKWREILPDRAAAPARSGASGGTTHAALGDMEVRLRRQQVHGLRHAAAAAAAHLHQVPGPRQDGALPVRRPAGQGRHLHARPPGVLAEPADGERRRRLRGRRPLPLRDDRLRAREGRDRRRGRDDVPPHPFGRRRPQLFLEGEAEALRPR